MRKNTKKIDGIIIATILLCISGGILWAALSHKGGESSAREGEALVTVPKAADYNGKTLGILTGSSFEPITLELFPDSEYLYFNTYSDLNVALLEHHIDAYVADEPVARATSLENSAISSLPEPVGLDNYHFMFGRESEKSQTLLKQFNELLDKFSADGTLEKKQALWLMEDTGLPKIDRSGLTGENGMITVGTSSSTPPFSMIRDGELSGLAIDLAYCFARSYGYEIRFEDTDLNGMLAGLAAGKYDLLACPLSKTPEREERAAFSQPFYSASSCLMVRTEEIPQGSVQIEDRPFAYYAADKKIGAITGGLYEVMIRERYPEADILQFNNQPDMAVALGAGIIDAFTCPESTAKDFMKEDPSLTYLKEVFMEIPYGFAFEKDGKRKLPEQMNEFLKKLRQDGVYDEMISTWFGEDESVKTVDTSGLTGENGSIRYITAPTMQPFSYMANGKNAGLEVDLVTRFCREYGYSLTIDNGEFASLIPGISSGMYDIASGTIMITPERAESVDFSDVYYTANAVAVVRREGEVTREKPSFMEGIAESFRKNFIRESRWKLIVDGIATTCLITVLSTLFGSLLAFLICMFRRTGSRLAKLISDLYVRLLQGTPMVVLLMILYYVILGKSGIPAVWVAVIGFTLNFGAYASEIMRSGIESIDPGQQEAALALGFNENQAFFKFIFPQAAVRFLPVYSGEIISLLKSTSIVGYIAIQDLTKMSDIIRSRTYEAFFPLIATAVIYFLLAGIVSLLLKFILKQISPKRKRG